jgi:hypothetical protein
VDAEPAEACQLPDALGDAAGKVLPWEGDGNDAVANTQGAPASQRAARIRGPGLQK